MDQVDIEKFRVSSQQPSAKRESPRGLPRPTKGENFFAGPIPWSWWAKAARLQGKALQVATALWHIGAMKKSRRVLLQGKILKDLGVSRKSVYRVLRKFERVGLVVCERGSGRRAIVTILDVPFESNGNGKESRMTGENE